MRIEPLTDEIYLELQLTNALRKDILSMVIGMVEIRNSFDPSLCFNFNGKNYCFVFGSINVARCILVFKDESCSIDFTKDFLEEKLQNSKSVDIVPDKRFKFVGIFFNE